MVNYKSLILNKKSLSYEVAQYIKEQIINGEIELGSQINLQEIGKVLEISQTPVREAIQHLVAENVLTNVRNKGYFVKEYDENDIFEIYSIRAVLEAFAIRLATIRATDEEIKVLEDIYNKMKIKLNDDSVSSLSKYSVKIHERIIQMSKHERLIQLNENISFQVAILNRILGTKYTKQQEVYEHKELIDVIKTRNSEEAEKVMRKHIFRSYKNFLDTYKDDDSLNTNEKIFPF